MNKTLADLLRLFILLNLIVLAFQTLPKSDPAQPTPTIAQPPLPTKSVLFSDAGKAASPQTTTRYYLQTGARHTE